MDETLPISTRTVPGTETIYAAEVLVRGHWAGINEGDGFPDKPKASAKETLAVKG